MLTDIAGRIVVSYRNSTSNHNRTKITTQTSRLYLIEILHQTTTDREVGNWNIQLYLIEILHQTTTCFAASRFSIRCILSKFYIKPQQVIISIIALLVVSYRNSTSNHNCARAYQIIRAVVSYRNSTSNHNFSAFRELAHMVVSYRNSTSNHNNGLINGFLGQLYLIEILHQTTTFCESS